MAVLDIIAQTKLAYHVVAESTTSVILHAYSDTVGVVMQEFLEIGGSPLIDDKHRLTLVLLLTLLVAYLALMNLYSILLRKPSQRLRIGELLVFHDKTDRIAALSATETMAGATGRTDHERRCLLVVERTQSLIVCSTFLQCDKLRNNIYDVCSFFYTVNCRSVNHCLSSFLWQRYKKNMRCDYLRYKVFAPHERNKVQPP